MIYYKIVDAWKESIFAKHYYFSYQFIKQYLNCITVKNVKVKTTYTLKKYQAFIQFQIHPFYNKLQHTTSIELYYVALKDVLK